MGDLLATIFDYGAKIAGGVGLPGVIFYLFTQRRKARVDNRIAERTENAAVSKEDSGALEAHVLAVERAFQAERESKDRVIASLRTEYDEHREECSRKIRDLELALERKDRTIGDLRADVGTLTERLERLERQQTGGQ